MEKRSWIEILPKMGVPCDLDSAFMLALSAGVSLLAFGQLYRN
jgi:hypothetical protein